MLVISAQASLYLGVTVITSGFLLINSSLFRIVILHVLDSLNSISKRSIFFNTLLVCFIVGGGCPEVLHKMNCTWYWYYPTFSTFVYILFNCHQPMSLEPKPSTWFSVFVNVHVALTQDQNVKSFLFPIYEVNIGKIVCIVKPDWTWKSRITIDNLWSACGNIIDPC